MVLNKLMINFHKQMQYQDTKRNKTSSILNNLLFENSMDISKDVNDSILEEVSNNIINTK